MKPRLVLTVQADGRLTVVQVQANSWRAREQLLALQLHLSPALAALDVGARLWRDLKRPEHPPEGVAS